MPETLYKHKCRSGTKDAGYACNLNVSDACQTQKAVWIIGDLDQESKGYALWWACEPCVESVEHSRGEEILEVAEFPYIPGFTETK